MHEMSANFASAADRSRKIPFGETGSFTSDINIEYLQSRKALPVKIISP